MDFDRHFDRVHRAAERQQRSQWRWARASMLATAFYRLCLLSVAGGAVYVAGRLGGVW